MHASQAAQADNKYILQKIYIEFEICFLYAQASAGGVFW